ncbi:MAG: hypothetical protein AAF366_02205 [Pseudomonadota bacterium]
MTEDERIAARLADAADDTTPLSDGLRAAILADAARVAAPPGGRPWLAGLLAGLPAAAAGLWLGLAQPALVLQLVPGLATPQADDTEIALLDDVFGVWEDDG